MDIADWAFDGKEDKVYLFKWTEVDKVWSDDVGQLHNWRDLARACDQKIQLLISTSGASGVTFGAQKCKELVSPPPTNLPTLNFTLSLSVSGHLVNGG
jgi:hypothetical protein